MNECMNERKNNQGSIVVAVGGNTSLSNHVMRTVAGQKEVAMMQIREEMQ
jgi:hypothetical protein